MRGKEFYKSKTFWFNVLALVVMLASAFGFAEFESSAELQQYGVVIITLVNVLLRFVTREPLKVR